MKLPSSIEKLDELDDKSTTTVTSSATKASGFDGFKTGGSDNVFYWYSGTTEKTLTEYKTNSTSTYYTAHTTTFPSWVKKKTISRYTYKGNSIDAIEPGTFPQFGHCWSSVPKVTLEANDSFLKDYVDVELDRPTDGSGMYYRITRYAQYLEIGTKKTTETSYTTNNYSESYFKDKTIPQTIFVLMVGAGGGGGCGGIAIGGGDGSGGAGGATAFLALTLAIGVSYYIYLGAYGTGGAPSANSGKAGEGTTLSKNNQLLVTAGGGDGGYKGEWSGDTGTAAGGTVTQNTYSSDYTILFRVNGGQGGGAQGSSQPGNVSAQSYSIPGTLTSIYKQNYLDFPMRNGGKWTAGTNQYCAPGGASLLGVGGDAGDNISTSSTNGGAGRLGSGGGGGRYYFGDIASAGTGGNGGKGVVMLFC